MSRRSRTDGKVALAAKINQSIESLNAAFKQTVKGSHSSEILTAAIRNFVQQENVIQNSQRHSLLGFGGGRVAPVKRSELLAR
ncbi:hypothetical protein M514_18537 [Trichuris suis]|uniref:BLOC-1-related complex subunit 7 n=1 Tax=Trichuris suis TaxID=68888 RepID=A0A085NIU2_9BILA|nr:hypothetical protein M514_18537 [Trichuris suis]